MRVLLTTWAWATHYFPMVPLGWAIAAAGHEVRVASQPGLAETISRSGLAAVPVGRDLDLTASPRLAPVAGQSEQARLWLSLEPRCTDLCEAMVDDLEAFIGSWRPDLVVWDWMTLAAPIAAARTGTPNMRLLFGPDFMTFLYRQAGTSALWPRELFARYGVELDVDKGTWGGETNLDLCPPSVQLDGVPGMAMRYVPYNGPAAITHPILPPSPRPRVCLTMGLTTMRVKGRDPVSLAAICEALADLDLDVVATVTPEHKAQLGILPPNATVLEMCPLDPLLAECSVVVHQASAGGTMTAANRGLPQVMLPLIADQPLIADRIGGTGAAIALPPEVASPATVREAVLTALTERRYRDAGQRLRAEIGSTPSPAAIVSSLALSTER